MTDQSHLRIGTADRLEAAARINQAAMEGRLTPAEAAERVAKVDVALVYGDLNPLLADLPVAAPSAASAGWGPGNPLILSGGMSRERRTGPWEIPPYLRLSADFGSVRLDCREAVCLAPVIDIDVNGVAGSITLLVPTDWGVDCDQVAKGWGSLRNTANPRPEPGQPQLVLHGTAGMGRIRVRPVVGKQRRRSQRELGSGQQGAGSWTEEHTEMPNSDDLR